MMGKGENASNQHFFLFPQCFLPIPKRMLVFDLHLLLHFTHLKLLFGKELNLYQAAKFHLKLKAFVDNLNVAQMVKFLFGKTENIMRKCWFTAFSCFPVIFLSHFIQGIKSRHCVVKGYRGHNLKIITTILLIGPTQVSTADNFELM